MNGQNSRGVGVSEVFVLSDNDFMRLKTALRHAKTIIFALFLKNPLHGYRQSLRTGKDPAPETRNH
jgi:hypothetical protein